MGAPLRAVKKIGANLQEKCVKCTPQDTKCTPASFQKKFLGQFLLGGLDLEVYLDGLWGRRLKKVVNFFGQKSAPPDKILATPMLWRHVFFVQLAELIV